MSVERIPELKENRDDKNEMIWSISCLRRASTKLSSKSECDAKPRTLVCSSDVDVGVQGRTTTVELTHDIEKMGR